MTETTTRPYLTEVPRLTDLVQGDEIQVTVGIPGLNAAVTTFEIVEEIDATRGWLTTRYSAPLNGWEAERRIFYGEGHPGGAWVRTLLAISEPVELS